MATISENGLAYTSTGIYPRLQLHRSFELFAICFNEFQARKTMDKEDENMKRKVEKYSFPLIE